MLCLVFVNKYRFDMRTTLLKSSTCPGVGCPYVIKDNLWSADRTGRGGQPEGMVDHLAYLGDNPGFSGHKIVRDA